MYCKAAINDGPSPISLYAFPYMPFSSSPSYHYHHHHHNNNNHYYYYYYYYYYRHPKGPKLTVLNLSRCPSLNEEGWRCLTTACYEGASCRLEELDLSRCEVSGKEEE